VCACGLEKSCACERMGARLKRRSQKRDVEEHNWKGGDHRSLHVIKACG